MAPPPIKLMIIDDSALYRQTIGNVLRDVDDVKIVGRAANGIDALRSIEEVQPDLLTLDVQMPDLDGIGLLREINARRLKPKAIMVSSLTSKGAQVTTDALLEGAFDFILKPSGPDPAANLAQLREELLTKIETFRKSAAGPQSREPLARNLTAKPSRSLPRPGEPSAAAACRAIVIGTSTGGPAALKTVLPGLPASLRVPVLVVQHMPPGYTTTLARRLDGLSELDVVEAVDGLVVRPGMVVLAAGGKQLQLTTRRDAVEVRLTDDPPENACRPAVDYLLRSAAEVYDGQVLSVIMTGMGRDGVDGSSVAKERGGTVFAKHEYGCLVYGMPKAVIEAGLADRVLPLGRISAAIHRHVGKK